MAFKSITYARPVPALLLVAAVFFGAQTEVHADDPAANGAHTVLITGANRGLGLEFARQYKEAGWQVIGTARKPGEADDLEALDVQVVQLDVADQGSVDRMAAELMDQPIDLLINNAGIFPRVGKIEEVGPVRVTRALLPNLRQGKLKIVAGLSSNLGSIAENERGNFYGYRESKAALNMFTKTLAAELGPEGFTCVVLTPGWVQTDMGGPNATLTPAESIAGMKAVLDKLTPAENGTFWSYDGSQMPW